MQLKALSESPIGRAVKYLTNQWDGLIRFLGDPRSPITSNAAEGALRALVLGRNNHFGSNSRRGTEGPGEHVRPKLTRHRSSLVTGGQVCGCEPNRRASDSS